MYKGFLSAVVIAVALLITSCSSPNLDKADAGFIVVTNALIEFRAPCVDDNFTNDALCKIDDDLYRKVDILVDAADLALDEAHKAAMSEDSKQVDYWLKIFIENFKELETIVNSIEENT